MADKSDGNIIINTKLDNTGLKKNGEELKKYISSLTKAVENLGAGVKAFAESSLPTTQQLRDTLQEANAEIAKFDPKQYTTAEFKEETEATSLAIAELTKTMESLSRRSEKGFTTEKSFDAFNVQVAEARATLETLQNKIEALARSRVTSKEWDVLKEKIRAVNEEAEKEFQQSARDGGIAEESEAWHQLREIIYAERKELEEYRVELARLVSEQKAFNMGADTGQYQQITNEVRQLVNNLAQIKGEITATKIEIGSAGLEIPSWIRPIISALGGLGKALQGAATAYGKFFSIMGKAGLVVLKGFGKAVSKITSLIKKMTGVSNKANFSSKGLIKTFDSLKRIMAGRVKRLFVSYLINETKMALKSLLSYSAQFNNAMSSMRNATRGLAGNVSVAFANIVNAIAPAVTTIINLISQAITWINAFFALIQGRTMVTVAKKQMDSYADSLGGAGGAAKALRREVYGFDELNRRMAKNAGGGGGGAGDAFQDMFEDVSIDGLLPSDVKDFFTTLKELFEGGEWYAIGEVIADGLNLVVGKVNDWIVNLTPKAVEWAGYISSVFNGMVDKVEWETIGRTIRNGLDLAIRVADEFFEKINFKNAGKAFAKVINEIFDPDLWARAGKMFANGVNSIVDWIAGAVEEANWADIGTSIRNFIDEWWTNINWKNLSTTVANGINGILTAIESMFESENMNKLGKQISDFFNDAIKLIDWGKAGTLVGTAIQSFFTNILDFFAGLNWEELGTNIGTFIQSALDKIEPEEWGPKLTKIGTGIFNGISKAVEKVEWDELGTKLAKLAGSINVVDIIRAVVDLIHRVITSVGLLAKGYFVELGLTFLDAIADLLLQVPVGFVQGWGHSIKNFTHSKRVERDNEYAGHKLTGDIADSIDEGTTEFIIPAAENMGSQIGTSTAKGITEAIGEVKLANDMTWWELTKWIWAGGEETADHADDAGQEISEGLADGIIKGASNLGKVVEDNLYWGVRLPLEDKFQIKSPSKVMYDMGMNVTAGLVDGIEEDSSDLTDWASDTPSAMEILLKSGWSSIKTITDDAWKLIRQSLLSTFDKTTKEIDTKFTTLRAGLVKIDWTDIGTNVLAGLKNGINAGWSSVSNWVTSKFRTLVNNVKRTFGIASPSKVFAEIGANLMQGLSIGVDGESRTPLKTVSNIADAIINEVENETPTLSLLGDLTIEGMRAVTSELANVANMFMDIAGIIDGGIQIPAIAMGTVAPYYTRVEETSTTDNFSRFTSNFDETMSNQEDLLRELISVVSRLDLRVDGDSLTRAITSLQRSQERTYGGD